MKNPLFNILGVAFIVLIGFNGVHCAANNLKTQADHVSSCIDQAGAQFSTC